MIATPLTGPVADHGEGPVWDPREGMLRCVDLLAGDLLTVTDDGAVRRDHVGDVAAAFRPRRAGGWVLARERDVVLLDADLRVQWSTGPLWDDPTVRFNDGACDPAGAFWCGSMAYDERPGAGSLWRLDADRTVTRVEDGLTIANGLAFDDDLDDDLDEGPGAVTGLHVDTPTGRVDRITLTADGIARREHVVVEPGAGFPDGLTVDAAGGLWVALWEGGAVRHHDARGRLDAVVELPVSRVTACTLGGPGFQRLYVTTSAQGVDRADEPLAGAVFAVDVAVPGRPVRPFHG